MPDSLDSSALNKRIAELEDLLHRKEAELVDTKNSAFDLFAGLEKSKQEVEEQRRVLEENQKALRLQNLQTDAILASIGEGLIATNEHGRITRVNEATLSLLGYGASELHGQWISKFLHVEDENGHPIAAIGRPMSKALIEGKPVTQVVWYVRKDGTRFPAAATAAPILLDDAPIGGIEVFRDVTKEVEIDKAKSEFVSLASHQLNSPLAIINWYVEMILHDELEPKQQKEFLEKVYLTSQRMVQLVRGLLNVARIELGTFSISPEPLDLEKLCRDVVDEQRMQVEKKKLKVTQSYGKLPLVEADQNLATIVFQNLLTNAVKYTPEGGSVKVDLAQQGEEAVLTVSDTGYGIPKEQQGKIFSKLFRADNVREAGIEGTGLGLYMVKSIVESSGGRIWFESEAGKGTTFHVALPISGMKKREGTKRLESAG